MDDDTGDVVGRKPVRMALDARVLETVGGLARLEHLAGRAGGHHVIGHPDLLLLSEELGRAVVPRDVARRIENLAVDDRQLRAGGTDVAQPQPAVDVLPQVGHLAVGPNPSDGDGSQLLHPAGRRRRGIRQGPGRGPRP
jgi:hypothetical protein